MFQLPVTDPFVATLDKLTSGKEGNMVFTFVEAIGAKSTLYFKLYYFAPSKITENQKYKCKTYKHYIHVCTRIILGSLKQLKGKMDKILKMSQI